MHDAPHVSPRHSTLGALRESYLGARQWQGVIVEGAFTSANISPAYSVDSSILACGFGTTNEGSILIRRTPDDQDGKEATSLAIAGGPAWYPTTNKFYCGASGLNQPTGNGACVVIDPTTEQFKVISTGFSAGQAGGRCLYHPDAGDIWMRFGYSGKGFARIDPSDDSVSFVTCATPSDFTYCSSNQHIYFSTAGSIYKVDTSGSATLLFDETALEALGGGGVTGLSFGAIEYIDSLDIVLFYAHFFDDPGGTERANVYQIDTSTDAVTLYYAFGALSVMWYTTDFDRIIVMDGNNQLRSWLTDFSTSVALNWNGTATDAMTASKGCYCDNITKIALPVLTGPAGGRFYSVNFFGAGDL